MPYGAIFAQTLLQRKPAGARVVIKAIKARAPRLVVHLGVIASLASAAAKLCVSTDAAVTASAGWRWTSRIQIQRIHQTDGRFQTLYETAQASAKCAGSRQTAWRLCK